MGLGVPKPFPPEDCFEVLSLLLLLLLDLARRAVDVAVVVVRREDGE